MSEATPIEPVNATSTSSSPQPSQEGLPMEGKLIDVMNAINQKYGGDPNEFSSLSKIVDKVEAAEKQAPAAHAATKEVSSDATESKKTPKPPIDGIELKGSPKPPLGASPESQGTQKTPTKEKIKVGSEEFELDPDQIKRFAQKGVHYEKKAVDFVKREKALAEKEAQINQSAEQNELILKALHENPGQTLEELFGAQIFEKMKPWAASKVQKEMEYEQNPQLRMIEEAQNARFAAEEQLKQFQAQQEEQLTAQQAKQFESQFEKTIVEALQAKGLAKTDFTAAEMAGHMSRAIARGIDLNPEQLAQITLEDNTTRIRAHSLTVADEINEARKANDTAKVIQLGERVVEMYGEPLMYAMAKYHLAKLQSRTPAQPKQVLDAPKVLETAQRQNKQYMTEDQVKDIRRQIVSRMERGEEVPENIWDTIGR